MSTIGRLSDIMQHALAANLKDRDLSRSTRDHHDSKSLEVVILILTSILARNPPQVRKRFK